MSDYGVHPTQYGKLSNEELYSMYRESTFTALSDAQKLDLLQETVNRDAAERGMAGAPQVTYANLPSNIYGRADKGIIEVNQEMVTQGQTSFQFNGDTIVHQMPDANCKALNTVIHENIHSWQEQILDGTISIDDENLLAEYQANCFTNSAVLQNGSYKMGSHYLNGVTSYHAYYFQSTERDAHKEAEVKTTSIIQALTEKFGSEKSFVEYDKNLQSTGYQKMEEEAIRLHNNPSFEKDVNQVLMNQHYGTNVQVDEHTASVVKTEMTASYQEQNKLENEKSNLQEEKDMEEKENTKEAEMEREEEFLDNDDDLEDDDDLDF